MMSSCGIRYAAIPAARLLVARLSESRKKGVSVYEALLDADSTVVTDAVDDVVMVRSE